MQDGGLENEETARLGFVQLNSGSTSFNTTLNLTGINIFTPTLNLTGINIFHTTLNLTGINSLQVSTASTEHST